MPWSLEVFSDGDSFEKITRFVRRSKLAIAQKLFKPSTVHLGNALIREKIAKDF